MMDREKILKSAHTIEDRMFLSKTLDRAIRATERGYTTYTDFLDPRQQMMLQRLSVPYYLYGGFEGAERAVAAFGDISPEEAEFPVSVLQIKTEGEVSHRDVLGSVMGLGIKREKVGDILVGNPIYIVVSDDISEYLTLHWNKIGNKPAEVTAFYGMLTAPEKKQKTIWDTVASLRLDAVCAAAFGLSRSNAVKLIQQQRVFVNYEMNDNVSHILKGGETLSAKGFGKAVLEEVAGKSRKDRTVIVIQKYI